MSFRNPVGPQPASVYWRRRILVLLGLIAVIAAIVLIVVRPGASAAPTDPTPSPTPTATTEPAPSPEASPEGPPNAVAACAPGQVQVTAVTDKATYGPDELPQLSFTIANVGAAPCSLNVGTSAQVFTISSGSDTIWTSTDCQSGAVDQTVTLAPATPASSSPFTWERQRSSPDTCGQPDRPTVAADGASYHLTISVGGVQSAESGQFILD